MSRKRRRQKTQPHRRPRQVEKQKSSSARRWWVGVLCLIIAVLLVLFCSVSKIGDSEIEGGILPATVQKVPGHIRIEPRDSTVVAFNTTTPDPNAPCDPNETWYYLGDIPHIYGEVIKCWSTDDAGYIEAEDNIRIVEGNRLCLHATIRRLPSPCSFAACMGGPGNPPAADHCGVVDYNDDGSVDLLDYQQFQIDPQVNRDTPPGVL